MSESSAAALSWMRIPSRFPLASRSVPGSVAYGYLITLNIIYVLIRVHTPMAVYAGAPHDDTLFMVLGEHLAQGEWLGPYSQFTLMKGPGYPAFLALNFLLGTPLSLTTALLHCLAVTSLVVVCHNFIRSYFWSGLLFALLLFHPFSLSLYALRVYRESIYHAEMLLFLSAAIATLFVYHERHSKLASAALTGALLGWFWLTREEGVWILPGTFVLLAGAALLAYRTKRIRQMAAAVAVIVLVFGLIQGAFRAANWWVYGSFVGVDFKEHNYQRALRAIHSVRSGGNAPYMSIIKAARERVYAVSPSFAAMREALEGAPAAGWARISCTAYKSGCGEVGVGFFIFSVRDAASGLGYYETPAKASAFWGKVADEIEAACARGALECKPQLIAEMPQVSWREIWQRLPGYFGPLSKLVLFWKPPIDVGGSGGDDTALAPRLRFLNYPLHSISGDISTASYEIAGWYYQSGNEWVDIVIKDYDGGAAEAQITRVDSPDVAAHFKDPAASSQRFLLRARCRDECRLQITAPNGDTLEKTFGELKGTPISFRLGGGQAYIDRIVARVDAAFVETRSEKLAGVIRNFIMKFYQYVFIPIFILGALVIVASTLFTARRAIENVCYQLAVITLVYVASRMGLLTVMGVTSLSEAVLKVPAYTTPAQYLLVASTLLSIVAGLQLFGKKIYFQA